MTFMTTVGATRFIRHGHACIGVSGPAGITLTAGDRNNSLLWSRRSGQESGKAHAWSPYGQGNATDGLPGFNGERCDPVSGTYHLGNGYRAYNPVLRRFNCPDSLSPFGAGGINPYAYCAGDPVNHTDPTGHISWQGVVGIVGGVIGLGLSLFTAGASIAAAGGVAAAVSSASTTALVVGGLGIAADVTGIASGATEDVNPSASSVLGWVSMATGLAGMAAGTVLAPKGVRALKQATAEFRQRLGNIQATGMSGRGASVAARDWETEERVKTLQHLTIEALHGEIPDYSFPNETFDLSDTLQRLNNYIYGHETNLSKLRGLAIIHEWRGELNITERYLHNIFRELRHEHIKDLDDIARIRKMRGVESDFAFLPGVGINEYYRSSPLLTHGYNRLGLLVIDSQNRIISNLTKSMKRNLIFEIFNK